MQLGQCWKHLVIALCLNENANTRLFCFKHFLMIASSKHAQAQTNQESPNLKAPKPQAQRYAKPRCNGGPGLTGVAFCIICLCRFQSFELWIGLHFLSLCRFWSFEVCCFCIFQPVCVCLCLCVCIYIHAYMCFRVCVCFLICVCMFVCMFVCVLCVYCVCIVCVCIVCE